MLMPHLRAELEVRTPASRGPGRAWQPGPARLAAASTAAARPTRVGYARCSTAQQELQSQLDALHQAGCDPVFSEKISTRIKVRPEFAKAMGYARTIKQAVPHQRVIFTVHEMKRLGGGAAELLAIAEELRHHDIELELLTGPLQGIYNPSGHGAALFAFFAGMAESEREYVREKSLGAGRRPRTRPPRRAAPGVRRRHDRLRPVAARARRGRARHCPQAGHSHRQEQRAASFRGQRLPGPGRRWCCREGFPAFDAIRERPSSPRT
jgi:DNA invertase Pin-like site-specific DNA recombinase